MKTKYVVLAMAAMLLSGATLDAQSAVGAVFEKEYHLFPVFRNGTPISAIS